MILDLFSGVCGWLQAARNLGLEGQGVEMDDHARETAEKAGHVHAFRNAWRPRYRQVTGLVGSPPCQTFSQAGRQAGYRETPLLLDALYRNDWEDLDKIEDQFGDRTGLILTPLHYVQVLEPEWVALEQVGTALPIWDAYARCLRYLGYKTWWGPLYAEKYGLPQTRRRAFLLAAKNFQPTPPPPTHSKFHTWHPERYDEGVKPWVSMREVFGPNQRYATALRSNYADRRTGDNGLRQTSEPAFTVTGKVLRNFWVVDGELQRVTAWEAGVLQGFPEDYPWSGPMDAQAQQIGNAVPVPVAEAILRQIMDDDSRSRTPR